MLATAETTTLDTMPPTITPPDACETTWYVLLIEPQQEVRVYTQLKSYRLNVYLPLVPGVTTRGPRRTKTKVYRPMMPGYLFVDEQSLEHGMVHIENSAYVHNFLKFGDVFATVPDHQMQRVRNIEAELGKPKSVQSIWSVGEVARISDGPFWGLTAKVTDLADGRQIRVEVALLGRAVRTSMDSAVLEKL